MIGTIHTVHTVHTAAPPDPLRSTALDPVGTAGPAPLGTTFGPVGTALDLLGIGIGSVGTALRTVHARPALWGVRGL
ncbi:hypothetical protein ACWD26_33870 [Streptomyces sp. NPDC002787]